MVPAERGQAGDHCIVELGSPCPCFRQHSAEVATVEQDNSSRYEVRPEDVARLSPLGFRYVNMLGRYAFTLPEFVARGELRPLRDPKTANPDDEP